jgi:hypothetical protein
MNSRKRFGSIFPLLACAALFAAQTASAATVCCSCQGPPDTSKTACLQLDGEYPGFKSDCSKLTSVLKIPDPWKCDAKVLNDTECQSVASGKASSKCMVGPKNALDVSGETRTSAANPNVIADQNPIPLQLNAPIPGLNLNVVTGNSFGQYVAGAYRYGISIVAVAATVMFTFGAFLYLLGSAITSIQKGKQYMTDAIIGLLIVMSASLIMRTLNPDTVTLSFVQVDALKSMAASNEYVLDMNAKVDTKGRSQYTPQFQQFSPEDTRGSLSYPADNGAVQQPLKVPAFKMYQGSWAMTAFGPKGINACPGKENQPSSVTGCCTKMAVAGCGPAALATLYSFNGVQADPGQAADALVASGGRICNNGSTFFGAVSDNLLKIYPNYKLTYAGTARDGLVTSIGILRRGQPVMFLCGGCQGKTANGNYKSYPGHYMVLTGVDQDGQIFSVDDVGNPDPIGIVSITQAELIGRVGGYWYLEKK